MKVLAIVLGLAAVASAQMPTDILRIGDDKCDACLNMTKAIDQYVSSSKFLTTTKIVLQIACLKSNDVDACVSKVESFAEDLQKNLTKMFAGDSFCKQEGLCPSGDHDVDYLNLILEQKAGEVAKEISLALCKGNSECDDVISELAGMWVDDMGVMGVRAGFNADGISTRWTMGDLYNNLCGYDCCDQCANIASTLKKYFVNDRTNKLAYYIISAPCTFLPGRTTCRKNAQDRVDSFFGSIENTLDNADFCQRLPCCGKTFGDLNIPKADCLICRIEAKMISRAISQGANQQEVLDEANALCQKLPTFPFDLRDNCTDFVNNRYSQLYPSVQANMDNTTAACQALGYCNSNSNLFGCTGEPVDSCTTCIEAVNSFHGNVQSFADGTVSGLQRICDKLGPFSGPCVSLVQGTIPRLVSGIKSFFSPEGVCKTVKFCEK